MGGSPQERRTEVSHPGTASDALLDVHPARRTLFYRGVSMEFRPHGQRETVPSGFVELSTYRVDRTSDG
jgi:hypothetical protein